MRQKKQSYQSLLSEIWASLLNDGLTDEEFEEKKHLKVAPGLTVNDFIEASWGMGDIVREGNRLVLVPKYKIPA